VATLHVLRVFCGADGSYGNPLGVFLDGPAVPSERRQGVAAVLGFSETVFVDDRVRGVVQIFTPAAEIPYAGHPSVGTSWLLAEEGTPVDTLRLEAGDVATWRDGDLTWIRGRAEWAPRFDLVELGSAEEVEALDTPPSDLSYAWAWQDQGAGVVRARSFPISFGIDEDEATGAAATMLVTELGREILIRQGEGSEIHARPAPGGYAEIGGRVVLDELREYG
jgi:predicted PhzF superfamily epimerase YddE/YHI9